MYLLEVNYIQEKNIIIMKRSPNLKTLWMHSELWVQWKSIQFSKKHPKVRPALISNDMIWKTVCVQWGRWSMWEDLASLIWKTRHLTSLLYTCHLLKTFNFPFFISFSLTVSIIVGDITKKVSTNLFILACSFYYYVLWQKPNLKSSNFYSFDYCSKMQTAIEPSFAINIFPSFRFIGKCGVTFARWLPINIYQVSSFV